jgi:hypothetical protein
LVCSRIVPRPVYLTVFACINRASAIARTPNMMNDSHNEEDVAPRIDETPIHQIEEGNGSSLPSPEEARMNAPIKPSENRSLLIKVLVSILVATLTLCAIVIIVVKNRQGGIFKEGRQATVDGVISYISAAGISSNKALGNSGSPQHKAAEWLALHDGLNLAVPQSATDTKVGYDFVTRYVMAVNYFSLGGGAWKNQFRFLSETPTCMWTGVLYDGDSFYRSGVMCDGDGTINALYLGKYP